MRPPTISVRLTDSSRSNHAADMPTTGTSIEKGATIPAGCRAISHVHTPEPTTVPMTTV